MLVCRTCLTRKDLIPLFGELSAVKFDSFQLYIATGAQIKQNDGLPQAACRECVKTIRTILHFREISEKTQQILHSLTWNIKKENDCQSQTNFYQDIINGNENDNDRWTGVNNSNLDTKIPYRHTEEAEELPLSYLRNEALKNKNIAREFKTESNASSYQIKTPESSHDDDITDNIELTLDLKQELTIEDLESDSEQDSDNSSDLDNLPLKRKTVWVKAAGAPKSNNDKERIANKLKAFRLERQNITKQLKEKNQAYMALAVDPNSKGPMDCKRCHKRLKDNRSFIYHAKTHFEPEFTCETCGKKFRSRNHMSYHQQRRHGRVKRLACFQCGYRAVDRTTLLNHERLEHTGERPFTCDECGHSFRMRRAIVQHMKKHFGIKDQQCDRCPEMFKSASELWSHTNRVHLMSYTYPCYLCPESYKCVAAVKKHLFNAHGLPIEQQLKVKCVKIKKND